MKNLGFFKSFKLGFEGGSPIFWGEDKFSGGLGYLNFNYRVFPKLEGSRKLGVMVTPKPPGFFAGNFWKKKR